MLRNKLNKPTIFVTAILITLFALTGFVYAVNCWIFQFTASNPYPNPADAGTHVKETMNLCILGDDGNLYPALIRSVVYNSIGQKVYERTEQHNSSPSFQMVVWVVGNNVPSGYYTIKTRAESNLCGNSGWVIHPVTILN